MSKDNDKIYIKDLMQIEGKSASTIFRWKSNKFLPKGHKSEGTGSKLFWYRKELKNVEIYGRKLNV